MKIQPKLLIRSQLLIADKKNQHCQLHKEIAIMKKIEHPNLVRLHEVIDDPDNKKMYLILDYMDKGQISSRRFGHKSNISIPIEDVWKHFRSCLQGLDYCIKMA